MSIKPEEVKLDEDEQEIEDNFEKSKTLPAEEQARAVEVLKKAATNYLT